MAKLVVAFQDVNEAGGLQWLRDGTVDMIGSMSCWVECDLAIKVLLIYVCLGEDVPKEQIVTPHYIGPENTEDPYLYGNMRGVPFECWPILSEEYYESIGFFDYIPTPTLK